MANIFSEHREKIELNYLIDSGACFNVLRWDAATMLGETTINHTDKITLSSFDGSTVETTGSMLVRLHIGKFIYCEKFHVVEVLLVPGII